MTERRENRRLAAILSADVVEYSRLMGGDESGTLSALKAHRRELVDPKIEEHNGRMVKLMGDGALVEFASAVQAVRCAVEIQQAMAGRNDGTPEEHSIRFRIGINVGDVISEDDGDIYGDGVNIAARVQGWAEPGGICLSRTVRDQIRDKLSLDLEDMGELDAKNIARPIRVFCVRFDGDRAPAARDPSKAAAASAPAERPTIAVLPFDNMTPDPDQEFFADGIAEDILTALAKFRQFRVIARNSSFTYKGQAVDVKRVLSELGAHYVLEGSVRKAMKRVRITAQLIETRSGAHVWAERYDRDLEDIFAVQDEITASIIGSIAPGVMAAEIERAKRKHPAELRNWERLMRAHWHIRRFTSDDMQQAVRLLDELLSHEPENATALSDLAFALHFLLVFRWTDAPAETGARMATAARRAVAVDDQDSAAHTALAIHELFSGQHDKAARRLVRAAELNPNASFARGYLSIAQAFGGEPDAAVQNSQAAMLLSPRDPLMVIWHIADAWAYLSAARFAESAEAARHAIDWNGEFPDVHGVLAAALAHQGRIDEAGAALVEFVRRMPGLSVTDPRLTRPFRLPADRDRFLDGLRKAGLPEQG